MLILAIDSALDACSVGLLDSEADRLCAQEQLVMARGHAEAVIPMVSRVLDTAKVAFPMLDRIAVTIGPGSFTGIRVGISAARGLGLAAGRPVVGVSTLSAFAAPLLSEGDGPIISLVDARHGHVYMQAVRQDGAALAAPQIVPIHEVYRIAASGAPRLVGNAAGVVAEGWPSDLTPPTLVAPRGAPEISSVAWLGMAADPRAARPSPLYLKPADAKPQSASPLNAGLMPMVS